MMGMGGAAITDEGKGAAVALVLTTADALMKAALNPPPIHGTTEAFADLGARSRIGDVRISPSTIGASSALRERRQLKPISTAAGRVACAGLLGDGNRRFHRGSITPRPQSGGSGRRRA